MFDFVLISKFIDRQRRRELFRHVESLLDRDNSKKKKKKQPTSAAAAVDGTSKVCKAFLSIYRKNISMYVTNVRVHRMVWYARHLL